MDVSDSKAEHGREDRGALAIQKDEVIPGSRLGTARHHNTPGLTHRSALTDEHSAGADLAGWPEAEVGGAVLT